MLAAPFVLGALCLVPGAPLALLLARARGGRSLLSVVLVESVLLGLGWYLLVGTVLAHTHDLGRVQVLVPTLFLAATATAALVARWPRSWSGSVDRPRFTLVGAAVTVAFLVGAVLRTRPSYFLYQIGDFGEYVNRGNVLADGGSFSMWFTHGFSVVLALGHVALGEAREVEIMPFLGLAVMATALAIAHRVGASGWARVMVAVVFAIGVVPVWFSNFPASETLYALLQLAMLLFLVAAVQRRHLPTAMVGGAFAFPLMLTRGNALLMLPVVLAVLLVASLVVRRDTVRIVAGFTVAVAASLFAGFVYNSRYSYPYFIEFQMPQFFPERVWRLFDDLGGLRAAVPKGLVLAGAVAALVWLAFAVNARVGPPVDAKWLRIVRAAMLPSIVVAALLSLWWPLDAGGLSDALARYDPAVYLLAGLGLVWATVAFARDMSEHGRVALVVIVLVGAAFALLHAYRFPTPRYAPYFLYWDRYLWSEFYPLLVLMAAWGVALLERGWKRIASTAWRAVAGGVVAALAAASVWSLWSAGSLSREHTFLGDPYGDLSRLDDLSAGLTIVYSGIDRADMPEAIYHSNTFRLFALPLAETFGRRVLNIQLHPYAHDPQPTIGEVAAILAKAGLHRGALIEVLAPRSTPVQSEQAGAAGVKVRTIGIVDVEIPMLDRPIGHQPKAWRIVHFTLAVRSVSL